MADYDPKRVIDLDLCGIQCAGDLEDSLEEDNEDLLDR